MCNPGTQVVRIRRKSGEVVQECDVYIGRQCSQGGWSLPCSKWHNPYPLSKYSRDRSLELYERYLTGRIDKHPVTYNLEELVGKRLGCWCLNTSSIEPITCHGQVIMKIMRDRGYDV